jgi:A nuclease family of the HNH/ENDO VII superfamily with conserved AHH
MAGNNPSDSNNFSREEPNKDLISQFVPPVAPPLAIYDVIVASAIAVEAGLVYVQWHNGKDDNLNNEKVRFDPSKTDAQTAVKEHFASKRVEIKPEAESAINRANDRTFNLGVSLKQEGFAQHEVGPYNTRHTPEDPKESLGGFAKQAPLDSDNTQHAPEPEASQKPFISPKGNEPIAPSIDFSKDDNRISNPYRLRTNYEKAYGKLQEGYQRHHLIPDAVVQDNLLAQEARQRAGYDLDRASNLIGLPGTAKSYKQSDIEVLHSGFHSQWNDYVKEELSDRQKVLEGKYGSLDKVPADVLQRTMQKVENQLRGDIQNRELGIDEGWITPDYQKGEVKTNKLSQANPIQTPSTSLTASPASYTANSVNESQFPKTYQLNQLTKDIVDNNPPLKSALTAAAGYERLIKAQDDNQFQDYRHTASRDPQTETLTISAPGRGTIIEGVQGASISILQPLTEQDTQRFDTMRIHLNQGKAIAQTPPPDTTQQHVENVASLSSTQLKELSPRDLLSAVKTAQQWQKSEPKVPLYREKLLNDFRDLQKEEATIKVQHQQNSKAMERGERGLLNPLGMGAKAYSKAENDYSHTQNHLYQVEREIWQTKGSAKEIQDKQVAQERWSTHPFTQMVAALSEKLEWLTVKPHVQQLQKEAGHLQQWKEAAVALGRPESYVGQIREIQSGYLEGRGVDSRVQETMDRDMGQYQQQAQAQSQQADGGIALEA